MDVLQQDLLVACSAVKIIRQHKTAICAHKDSTKNKVPFGGRHWMVLSHQIGSQAEKPPSNNPQKI